MSAYIFDIDGTIINSYYGIVSSVIFAFRCQQVTKVYDEVYKNVIDTSVIDYMRVESYKNNLNLGKLMDDYKLDRLKTASLYEPASNLNMTLKELSRQGHALFVYTHKGDITNKILRDLGIDSYFKEVVTADSSEFVRKPLPSTILYLCDKYYLNKNTTFYVGDRRIDIECANNAEIKSVLLNSHNMNIDTMPTFRINDLIELVEYENGNKTIK